MLSQRGLIAFAVYILAGFCAVCAFVLMETRKDAEREARIAAENLVTAVARDMARNFEIYDLSLRAVVDNLKEPEVKTVSPRVRHMVLFDRSTTAKHMGDILVTDERGDVVVDSQSLAPRIANLADREWFQFHQREPTFDLHISPPFKSRFTNEWSIAVSRRLTGPERRFAGIVVGTIRLSYFSDLFRSLELGPDGTMTLFINGGTLVMREPFSPGIIGKDLTMDPQFRLGPGKTSGSFIGKAVTDGIDRLFTYRQVGELPLVLSLGFSTEAIYRTWRMRAAFLGFIVLALCLAAVSLLVLLQREFRRRRAVEQRLEALAGTDALTGLENRRRFDETFAREWARCRRNHAPCALLLIDADHFKLYNDSFGHQSGDTALRAIADTISLAIRTTDHAGRYGGEEFVVLLPDTDLKGALQVAERIRARFAERKIAHPNSPHRVATISIGAACRTPAGTAEPASLIGAADRALYEAKARGRNRIHPVELLAAEIPQLKSA